MNQTNNSSFTKTSGDLAIPTPPLRQFEHGRILQNPPKIVTSNRQQFKMRPSIANNSSNAVAHRTSSKTPANIQTIGNCNLRFGFISLHQKYLRFMKLLTMEHKSRILQMKFIQQFRACRHQKDTTQ